METKYVEAIRCLNTRKMVPQPTLTAMRGSDDMSEWLSLIDYSVEDLRRLNAIHVAGTNGKGSTCAFVSSFLNAHGSRCGFPRKVGLYTSPHLKHIRERICINGEAISEECFATRFFEIWDKLPKQATPKLDIPRYLQFLALLAIHIFIVEKVDVAVFEAHLGGEWDATNILKPIVVGITTIAEDHVHLLGPTIEDIAWHKSGIFKSGAPALSAIQLPAVASVLRRRAAEKNVAVDFVTIDPTLPWSATLVPRTQRIICSLALALVRCWLRLMELDSLNITEDTVAIGLKRFKWPGRYQQINEGRTEWYLDGAHNISSLRYAIHWFAKTLHRTSNRILIFSQFSARDTSALLHCICECLQRENVQVHYTIFTSYDETQDRKPNIDRNLTRRFSIQTQNTNIETWKRLCPTSEIFSERTIQDALERARKLGDQGEQTQVLVTGSLHLVSGALGMLDTDLNDSEHDTTTSQGGPIILQN